VLSIRNLSKSFSGPRAKTVLRDISFELAAGDYVAVMGESGIGKSTLLNLIAGLERPDSGQVLLDGADLCALGDDALTLVRRKHMGFVFQAFHILPYLSVAQNVALPLALNGVGNKPMRRRVGALLDAVRLGERGESMPRELSGGRCSVAIARALWCASRAWCSPTADGQSRPEAPGMLALLRMRERRRRRRHPRYAFLGRCACGPYLIADERTATCVSRPNIIAGAHGQKSYSDRVARRQPFCRVRHSRPGREGLQSGAAEAGQYGQSRVCGSKPGAPFWVPTYSSPERRASRPCGTRRRRWAERVVNVDCYGDRGFFSFGSDSLHLLREGDQGS
jgi:putative ABC transport system ATP-binding protein